MSEEVKFNSRELIQMYSAVKEAVGRNDKALESLPLNHPERPQIMDQSKIMNGALRKLKAMLSVEGINIQPLQDLQDGAIQSL